MTPRLIFNIQMHGHEEEAGMSRLRDQQWLRQEPEADWNTQTKYQVLMIQIDKTIQLYSSDILKTQNMQNTEKRRRNL